MSFTFKKLSRDDIKMERSPESSKAAPENSSAMAGFKIAVLAAFILSLSALGAAIFLFGIFKNEKAQRETMEASQAQLAQKAETYEKSSAQYRSEMERVREQLKAYAEEKQQLKKQIEEAQDQVGALTSAMKSIQDKNKAMEEQAAKQLEEEIPYEEYDEAPAAAPAPASGVSVKPAASASAPAAPQAPQILTVNRKFNFAVVNLGLQQKVKLGDVILVERNGKTVANLQVEKLYESFSAATIVREPKDAPVKEGDRVRRAE